MAIIQATEHDLATQLRDGAVLVCLSSTEFEKNMKSERAARRFHHSFIEASYGISDIKFAQVDFANLTANVTLLGVSKWTTLPIVVLLKNGFELSRKTITVGDASQPDYSDKLIDWVRRHLAEADH